MFHHNRKHHGLPGNTNYFLRWLNILESMLSIVQRSVSQSINRKTLVSDSLEITYQREFLGRLNSEMFLVLFIYSFCSNCSFWASWLESSMKTCEIIWLLKCVWHTVSRLTCGLCSRWDLWTESRAKQWEEREEKRGSEEGHRCHDCWQGCQVGRNRFRHFKKNTFCIVVTDPD